MSMHMTDLVILSGADLEYTKQILLTFISELGQLEYIK